MKPHLSKHARWSLVLALLLGLVVAAPAPVVAGNEDSSAPLLASNELIGTLPCFWVDDGISWPLYLLGPTSYMAYSRMAATAFVDEDKIDELMLHAEGHGFVFLNHTGLGDTVRMRFYGDVRLGMNRGLLQSGAAQFGVTVGSHFHGGQGMSSHTSGLQASALAPFPLPKPGTTIFASLPTLIANQGLFGSGAVLWSKSKWNTLGYVQIQELSQGIWVTQDMPGNF